MATTDAWTDKTSGERREETEWHRIAIWNEHIGRVDMELVKKGSKVQVEGQIKTRTFEHEGHPRTATEIVMSRFKGELVVLTARTAPPDSRRSAATVAPSPAGDGHEAMMSERRPCTVITNTARAPCVRKALESVEESPRAYVAPTNSRT